MLKQLSRFAKNVKSEIKGENNFDLVVAAKEAVSEVKDELINALGLEDKGVEIEVLSEKDLNIFIIGDLPKGIYSQDLNKVFIIADAYSESELKLLGRESFKEGIVFYLAHELRHAHQVLVKGIDIEDGYIRPSMFGDNLDYFKQPVERDANGYAFEFCKSKGYPLNRFSIPFISDELGKVIF